MGICTPCYIEVKQVEIVTRAFFIAQLACSIRIIGTNAVVLNESKIKNLKLDNRGQQLSKKKLNFKQQ